MPDDTRELFLCTWGDIQLFADTIDWEGGNTQVIHNRASGDEHPVQPRGEQIKTTTAQLLFDDFEGAQETGIQAFRRFQATIKERRIFTHPMIGSYYARIGSFRPTMDANSVIRASCEIIPDGQVQVVSPAGIGTSSMTGETSVTAAADRVASAQAELGVGFPPQRLDKLDFSKSVEASVNASFSVDLSVNASVSANLSASASASASVSAAASATAIASAQASAYAFAGVYVAALAAADATAVVEVSGMASAGAFAYAYASAAVAADARATVAAWADAEDLQPGRVSTDVARLSDSIATMIELGNLERELQLFPAFRSAIMLGDSIRAAAAAATVETPTLFVMRVQTPTALIPLAARIYGGYEAQDRARQISSLNDVRTPGWLEPGDYLMPARPSASPVGA
jgi:hypothetical protein